MNPSPVPRSAAVPDRAGRPRAIAAPSRLIRKLGAGERALLAQHLQRLEAHDRAMRFMGTASDAHIEHYCRGEDGHQRLVLGYFVHGVMRGAGEIVLLARPAWCGACEIALSVEGRWQQRGVGSELLRRMVLIARNRGATPIRIFFLRENRRMHALARKFRMALQSSGGEVTGTLHPQWPNQLSLLAETLREGEAVMKKAWARLPRAERRPAPTAGPRPPPDRR